MKVTRSTNRGGGAALWAALVLLTVFTAGPGVRPASAQSANGAEVYQNRCAKCHQENGKGIPGVYPALAGDPFVTQAKDPAIQVVIGGRMSDVTSEMPRFDDILSNDEIAAVLTYVRSQWGNDAGPIRTQEVASQRSSVEASMEKPPEVTLPAGWEPQAEKLVHNYCTACHQDGGTGIEGIFPHLAHNAYVSSLPKPVIYTVLHGRGGMPSFAGLSNEQIAYILSYVRTHWGNRGTLISPEMVSQVKRPVPSYGDD